MKKIRCIICILLVLTCSIFMCSCENGGRLSFGTGNVGGNYYLYGSTFSHFLSEDNDKIKVNVKATAGSAANIRLIEKGFLDIGIVQSDMLDDAYSGTGAFQNSKCSKIRTLAGLYMEECQIIVREDSDIYSVSDLYGKKVSVGEKESGVVKNAEHIMSVNGISGNMVDKINLSISDAASKLESKEIDALFFTSDAPATSITELAKNTEIRVIPLDNETVKRMINNYNGYTACTIPANTYAGQTEDIQTIGVKAVLVASSKLSDERAEQILSTLFKNNSEIAHSTAASELDYNFAVSGIKTPFHNGALKWYKKQNIDINENMDSTEKSNSETAEN
ncbi:MAG: TAXI family TRAP transporter solute-binding subunit [Oscillospiraceae bacterium]|nr:TAXI family TRAP transporter solute-binding subunit [Oscillospiraceae bacterium]MDD6085074.1 TAXI family TRAP transporter solute-binding subunit [Oscillospiraceae bacterium]MDY3258016.1 TAXI family TRAP transporter solute-binding subunit [Ruminococcus callidus]